MQDFARTRAKQEATIQWYLRAHTTFKQVSGIVFYAVNNQDFEPLNKMNIRKI